MLVMLGTLGFGSGLFECISRFFQALANRSFGGLRAMLDSLAGGLSSMFDRLASFGDRILVLRIREK